MTHLLQWNSLCALQSVCKFFPDDNPMIYTQKNTNFFSQQKKLD